MLSRRQQRGLSIVEMMVGVTIGLLVVAAAALVVSTQLIENRRLILETQVQQDLRAAADIITRDLRRAGYGNLPQNTIAYRGATSVNCNTYAGVSPTASAESEVDYRYYRGSGSTGALGFKLQDGVLKYAMNAGAADAPTACSDTTKPTSGQWQDLTDGKVLTITTFSVTPKFGPAVVLQCPKLCPDGTSNCWPTVNVREFSVVIEGQAVSDAAVKRRIVSNVRLRNDWVRFNTGSMTRSCPA